MPFRFSVGPVWSLASLLIALTFSFALGAVLLAATNYDPLMVYGAMFYGVAGTPSGVAGTFTYAVPVMFTALAAAFAFRARVWNIGGDGQLFLGAWGATGAALFLPPMPAAVHLPLVILAGFACGALWAAVPAVLRAIVGANEIMTTLMMNYIAVLWVDLFIYGPWRDPRAGGGWPYSKVFPDSAQLPTLDALGTHLGLLLAVVVAAVLAIILARTVWGFELTVIGHSPNTARYAGMNVKANILAVMLVSGGVAGLAGMGEVAGVAHRLLPINAQGFGYIGILVAWLAGLNPLAVVPVSILYGALLQGGVSLQMVGVAPHIASMLEASIVIFLLIGNALVAGGKRRFTGRRLVRDAPKPAPVKSAA